MNNPEDVPFWDPLTSFLQSFAREDSIHTSPLEVLFAIALSFGLNCLIAAVYKRTYRGSKYSQDYVHTLLLLGTVVSVVIMVVRGSQSTAFGMFAAFSIIRFRSSVGQARDIGFIFLAMATGLAVGARAYAMVSITTPILCFLVWLLSRTDAFATRRSSHVLRIRVSNSLSYDTAFTSVFSDFVSFQQLESVETVQAGLMTELRYAVTLKETSNISTFIHQLQSINGNNRILMTPAGNNFLAE